MLTKLKINNFKPFGEIAGVRLAPITLVFGPNSAGKSSIIQSLLMLSQTINGGNRESGRAKNDLITRGAFIDLGNFKSLIHRHDLSKQLTLEYEFDQLSRNTMNRSTYQEFNQAARHLIDNVSPSIFLKFGALELSATNAIAQLVAFGFKIRGKYETETSFEFEKLGQNSVSEFEKNFSSTNPKMDSSDDDINLRSDGVFKLTDSYIPAFGETLLDGIPGYVRRELERSNPPESTESPLGKILESLITLRAGGRGRNPWGSTILPSTIRRNEGNADDIILNIFSQILIKYDASLRDEFSSLSYLGPLRTHPARYYVMDGVSGNTVGAAGEFTVQQLFHDSQVNKSKTTLIDRLNHYCVEFDIPYKFDISSVNNEITGDLIVLSLTDLRTNVVVAPSDVGFGVGQLLPILIEGILIKQAGRGFRRRAARIVCVEQPEIHLHPRLQAKMADFFIDTAVHRKGEKSTGAQWILETHSEALMLRLQRRIREKKISSQDVCVLYVESCGGDGSTIKELRLDEDGEFIDLWPDGFFVESLVDVMSGL